MRRVERPVFKYATTRTAQLEDDGPIPFITIYSLSLFMRSKNCQKNASIFSDFRLSPYFAHSLLLLPQRWEAIFASRLDDGRIPLYHHIQAYIHYSWGHIKSSSHFPIWTNGMNHLLTERKSIIPSQVTNLHFPRQWQCLFVEGGSSDSNLGPGKEWGGDHTDLWMKTSTKSRKRPDFPFQHFNAFREKHKTLQERPHNVKMSKAWLLWPWATFVKRWHLQYQLQI